MARNEEKAQSLLNKWSSMRQEFADEFGGRRPFLASEAKTLTDAERWRRDIVKEVSQRVQEIQNGGASEHVIRDLNDRINKLLREKWHWEKRIVELGGADYRRGQPRGLDTEGVTLPGSTYKYFGAAKNLPGVKELFQQLKEEEERENQPIKKPKKYELYKAVDYDYYGYRDEEDEELELLEEQVEKQRIQSAVKAYETTQRLEETGEV